MGQVVPFRPSTKSSIVSSSTSATDSLMRSRQYGDAIRLAKKFLTLALHEPSALKTLEHLVDSRLARFSAPLFCFFVTGGLQ